MVEVAGGIDGAQVQMGGDGGEMNRQDGGKKTAHHPDGQVLKPQPVPPHLVLGSRLNVGVENVES